MSSKIADLIDSPNGTHQIIPWQWLTSNSRKIMEIVFQVAFDDEQNFTLGFAIDHLKYIDVRDVKAIRYLDFRKVLSTIEEIQNIAKSYQYQNLASIYEIVSPKSESLGEPFLAHDNMIRQSSNLEDLLAAILNRLDAERSMSERDRAVLCSRADWYTPNPQTLDAIGRQYGLSRERIRQITKKFEEPLWQLVGELTFAKELSRLALEAESIEKLQNLASESFLTTENSLDVSQCKSIMQYLPNSKGWDGFSSKLKMWEIEDKELSESSTTITKYRSKMGFIDVAFAVKELGSSPEKIISVIKAKYPRFLKSRNLVLARTDSHVSTFESALAKQLLLVPSIEASDLLIGARRHASVRNDPMPGDESDYINIIHELCGKPPSLERFLENQLYRTELSELENWIVNIFNSSPNGLLHRVEITKIGIQSRVNLGSITVYCGSSPIIRTHSKGIFSLIGTAPTADQVSTHAELALSQDSSVEINLEFSESNIWLTLKPNLNAYASGVLLPNRELKDLFTDFIFSPNCICGPIDSKQVLTISKDGFWKGFQSIFSHALQSHDFEISSVFRIFFDFHQSTATLHP